MFKLFSNGGIFDFYNQITDGIKTFDLGYWAFVVVIGAILVSLLIANLLINTIKPLKKSLIPAPVLAGTLLFIVLGIYKLATRTYDASTDSYVYKDLININILDMITYHCLGIGFIATALKRSNKKDQETKKKNRQGIFKSSLVTVSTYILQAIIGLIISVSLYFIYKDSGHIVYPASGVIVPMGFGQGPGQALNWGTIYETDGELAAKGFGLFTDGATFGKAIAAMGFFAAAIGGIIYLAIQRKRGNVKFQVREEQTENNTLETYEGKNEIPTTGTIDKFTVQVAMVFLVYIITFILIYFITNLLNIDLVTNLLWGFNFIVGVGVATLVKSIISKCEKAGAIKRVYVNNYQLDRISGFAFDVMVVTAIGGIDITAFANKEFTLPLILMGIFATIGTYLYVKKLCEHSFNKEGYFEESFLCMYGMLTGTASTGVILLREIDPHFKTPALNNMVYQTLWSVVLGAPVLILMNVVASGWKGLITASIIYILYFIVLNLFIFKDKIFKHKTKTN